MSKLSKSLFSCPPLSPGATIAPTCILMDMIRGRDWSLVRFRALSHPTDLLYRNSNQSTALHMACLYRAPLDVIQLLLQLLPESAVLQQDSQGWTPLHVGILYAASPLVLQELIRQGGSRWTDRNSQYMGSALHVACRHGAPLTVLQTLLDYCPSLAMQKNESGTLPANLLWFDFRKRTNDYTLEELASQQPEQVQELMNKLMCMMVDGQDDLLMHNVVKRHADLLGLVQLLISMDPAHLQVRNVEGNLPLHIAVGEDAPPDSLNLVLNAYPQAASLRDAKGRLPLFYALQKGRTWQRGIESLVHASPESIAMRNEDTLLYPTQEAAVYNHNAAASACNDDDEDDDDEAERIETIFGLLTAWPPLCRDVHVVPVVEQ